jgi:hypothetical protein
MERYTKAFLLVTMICPFFLNGLGWVGRMLDHERSGNGLHVQILSRIL